MPSLRAGWRTQCVWLVLLAGLCLSTATHAKDFPKLKLPDSMQVQIVATNMRVNGVATRIYAFYSPETADDLAEYFAGQWDPMTRSHAKPWDILAHRDGDYLVTVQSKHADDFGATQGFIAFSGLFKAAEDGIKPPNVDVPMLPDTSVIQDLQSVDQGRPSRTLILRSNQSANQNLEFYRAYFRDRGYQPITHGALMKGTAGGAMILNRGNEELNVAVAQRSGITVVTIVRVAQ